MEANDIKALLDRTADEISENIKGYAKDILAMPEMGFKEHKTSEYVKRKLESLGLEVEGGLAVTGLKATLRGRRHEANICIMGELDAVTCPAHPNAALDSGAAHACGHNIQLANMLGCAEALVRSGASAYLDGDVTFMATPAEEFVELEYRESLKASGKISALSGKQEMLKLGAFDGIDCAMMVHSQAACPTRRLFLGGGGLGFVAKVITFKGKEAHAGGAPYDGINALNAAMAAIMCIHAMRETFRDEDKIRVHPIITKGGDLVNIVPANVVMETYVRGASKRAVKDASFKVDRAIKGAAYALGCEVEIKDVGGYAPLCQNKAVTELLRDNAADLVAPTDIIDGVDMVGSTDVGDLCAVLPAVQPTIGGFVGSAHSREFSSIDADFTDIVPVKLMLRCAVDLLIDGAAVAKNIKSEFDISKKMGV